MPKSSSKTTAIECLSEKLNILKSEIIAIGDNYNDIDMIQYAALGIAMGNAPDKVKLSADDVTLTNDENGVAESIKKYIINNY
jgi:hydroxymethylpyrimidine pyrophosphatase-like HAD family hydrolase